jgi:hypothetical protein
MHLCAIRSPLGDRGLEHSLLRERHLGPAEKKTDETLYRLDCVLIPLHDRCHSRLEACGKSGYGHCFLHKRVVLQP